MVIILKIRAPWAVRCIKAAQAWRISFGIAPCLAVAGLALSATSTADMAPAPVPVPVAAPRIDPRIAHLDQFFRHYRCPVPFHVSDYLHAADGYELDYRLLPAISVRETQCGVSGHLPNNHWGYHPDRQSFPSIEAGIDYVARQLAQNMYYRDKSLPQKLFVYNPKPAYPDEVQRIMRQIE